MKSSLTLLLVVPTLLLFACGGSTEPVDPRDAGAPPADAGQPTDAGGLPADAGTGDGGGSTEDAGTEDAGSPTEDAGTHDAGTTDDAGTEDAGSSNGDSGTQDAGSSNGDAGTVDAGTQTPPAAPTLIGTQPEDLGSEPQPLVLGTAEPGVTVELYNSFLCSGAVLATGTVGEEGRFAIRFPVSANASSYISAKARRGDRVSGCSATYESYTHDDRAPRVDEVFPANNATGVSLTAAPSARFSESMNPGSVKLAVTCGGQSVAGELGVSANRATFTPSASLPEQTTCTVTVSEGTDLAGNALTAHSWSFTTLRVPNPNPPTLTGTTPTSPGTSTTPSVLGTAGAGLRVELFTASDCSGSAVASGTASASGGFSIPVAVASNGVTTFRGQAVDSAGRRSTCSSTSVGYTHDGVAPTVVTVSPAVDATGVARSSVVRATLSESVTGVVSDLVLTCGSQRISGTTTFAATQVTFSPSSTLPYDFTCTATLAASVRDGAGNTLGTAYAWSFTMELGPAPNTPSISGVTPTSPGRSTTPSVQGNATAGIAVDLFTTADCSGTAVASGAANGSGMFTIPVNVAENSTTLFRAQTRNAAGRRSACSAQGRTYVHDGVAPTVASTSPAPDAVGVEPSATLTVGFSEPVKNTSGALTVECGGVARQGSVSTTATALIFTPAQPLPFDVSCTARVAATVTDLAGNPMAAYSWSFTMKDSPIPGLPTLSRATPASPGNSLTPMVQGTATAGHLIELYTGDGCGGTPVASGTVNAQGQFAIPVPVAANATSFIRGTARVSMARPASSCTAQALVYRHDGVAPTVVSVSPANDATDIQPSATLTVDFSELIVAQTGDVELRCSDVLLPGTVGVVERRLTFYPAVQLWIEAACTATVRTTVRDEAGNALAAAYSWAFMTRPAGWNPGPVVATASGSVTAVEVGLGNAGNATLVWQGGQSPYATTRHDVNPEQGVSSGLKLNTVDARTPAVAMSPNGHAVIAWVESASSTPARLVASVFIPGTGWTTPSILSTSGLAPNDPQVAIDDSGQALVVFRQHVTSSNLSYSIYARRFLPATGWQGLVEIDGVPQEYVDTRDPSVTRDGRGGFLVVWVGEFNRGSGFNEHLFFNWLRAGSTPGSASWSGSMYFIEELYPRLPKAGCDAQGNCTVVYKARSSEARAVRYDASGSWGTPFVLGPAASATEGVGVAVNATGHVVAAFSHHSATLSDYEVMARQYEPGVGWGTPMVVGPRTATRGARFFDVALDAQGNATVLSRQVETSASSRLYASRYLAGAGWLAPEELDSGIGWGTDGTLSERPRGPRVVMNASGQTLVTYWKGSTVYARWLE
jgi:hypothetical protein